ncbi:4-hydroxy-tetrahydrodipicolinate synthase [Planctomicrobium piriforme]|uniref:4-hydroxy-tetrahydrodipicolinate synthase n=1 Tax=Planctomicrobium piriforme TaxID=1576369 RepID=A0A1I3IBR9_9PLAN|nr:4-hydroxy-tetrahydrodipicolinate synthase [Planctomicrobium piriforme]SFI45465.1 4-hydroxy-tetrahydrodipicolinate synthase [Planctomicrobium piriforme]
MARKGEQFAGLTVALVTPFRNGDVDEAALRKLVDWHVEMGTNCVCPCGTTGESPTLSHDEHERVIALVCEQAAGRIKVMAGTGSNSTREAIRLTARAEESGADGALMVAPYYNKPMQDGFYQHFKAVAEAVDLPIVLYNIPGRTAKNMEPDTICKLAELKTIVAIKEATGSLDQASQILNGSNLTLLSGDDSLTLPLMSVGGSGVVSVAGNIVPKDVLAMIAAWREGNIAQAQKMHHKLFPLCRDMLGLATNPIPLKGAMQLLGRDTGEVRLPLTPLSEGDMTKLRQTLKTYGLLSS